jgi:hypothetical protein
MRKKKVEKSQAELDLEKKEFRKRNKKELNDYYVKCCKEFDLPYEPPFSNEEATEILKVAKQEEFGKLLKMFPNYAQLPEWEQLAAKCILKFGLDPQKFSLARKDWSKLNAAIAEKLGASRNDSSVNPSLYKFKKN